MDLKSIIKNRSLILEGIKNSLISKSDVEEIAKERKSVCDACPLKSTTSAGNEICDSHKKGAAVKSFTYEGLRRKKGQEFKGCGCLLYLKHRSLHSSCPLGKWEALTKDEELGQILREL